MSDINQELIDATRECMSDRIKLLLENGADINAKDGVGNTPLMWAANKGYLEIARFLVENGADIDARNNANWTALISAMQSDRFEMANYHRSYAHLFKYFCRPKCLLYLSFVKREHCIHESRFLGFKNIRITYHLNGCNH